mmetsp:Transcript_57302/g.163271  ORF Transcript_57302/g.163271 Transcript_57302/m.163271 type:complete len:297 (+) Transcript_57302:614-1504(+)
MYASFPKWCLVERIQDTVGSRFQFAKESQLVVLSCLAPQVGTSFQKSGVPRRDPSSHYVAAHTQRIQDTSILRKLCKVGSRIIPHFPSLAPTHELRHEPHIGLLRPDSCERLGLVSHDEHAQVCQLFHAHAGCPLVRRDDDHRPPRAVLGDGSDLRGVPRSVLAELLDQSGPSRLERGPQRKEQRPEHRNLRRRDRGDLSGLPEPHCRGGHRSLVRPMLRGKVQPLGRATAGGRGPLWQRRLLGSRPRRAGVACRVDRRPCPISHYPEGIAIPKGLCSNDAGRSGQPDGEEYHATP